MSERPSSSTSSTGHVDGLGRRSLAFDRTTGAILERLVLRPEIAAFEQVLQRRVAHLASLEDERFARPSAVERDPATGELVVVAEFVTGSRLSELLETAADAAVVPGVDVALGYLLESLPALSVLHTLHRVTHGLIDPTRTVITAEGQVVFLDVAMGTPIERLGLAPARLWSQFGVAALPSSSGPVRFDAPADIAQVALSALMLILGRNVRTNEFPDALPALLVEVIDVAQIRGSAAFATGLQRFFQRALPLAGRRPYQTADDAIADVRQLVLREIGIDGCRKAVVDFVENMDAAYVAAPASTDSDAPPVETTERESPEPPRSTPPSAPAIAAQPAVAADAPSSSTGSDTAPVADEDDGEELELSLELDNLAEAEPEKPAVEEVYELPPLDAADYEIADVLTSPFRGVDARLSEPVTFDTVHDAPASEPADMTPVEEPAAFAPQPPIVAAEEVLPDVPPIPVEPPAATAPELRVVSEAEPVVESPVVSAVEAVDERPAESAVVAPVDPPVTLQADAPVEPPVVSAVEPLESTEAEAPVVSEVEARAVSDESASSRRKKRQQQRSARARKDKLRSATTGSKPLPVPPPEPPPPARPASPTGWLVSPQRSAAFDQVPAEPAPPVRSVPLPAVPSFTPTPVAHVPQPVYTPSTGNTPAYGTPMAALHPPAPSPLTRTPAPSPTPPQPQVKIKTHAPMPLHARKAAVEAATPPPPIERPAPPDRLGTLAPLGLNQAAPVEEPPRAFPWKLAAVAVIVAVVAIVVGRSYLPGQQTSAAEPTEQVQAAPPAPAPTPEVEPTPDTPIPTGRGRLIVQTQPAGIRVLVDRKPAGETPLTIDIPPGRRTLTFVTTGGEVNRAVRIVAGKATTLDIPVFSGWLSVVAPFVLEIAENGQRIATTEQNRITLPPGKHQLTLSNREFGYSSTQDIEIEPGGVKSVTVDPRGAVSLNAQPWAEVWLNGQKIGDTPLVTQVPLGNHEFVFKHPQHGERRVSATVRATGTSPLSVDFTK